MPRKTRNFIHHWPVVFYQIGKKCSAVEVVVVLISIVANAGEKNDEQYDEQRHPNGSWAFSYQVVYGKIRGYIFQT
jgi:hypothetical protein